MVELFGCVHRQVVNSPGMLLQGPLLGLRQPKKKFYYGASLCLFNKQLSYWVMSPDSLVWSMLLSYLNAKIKHSMLVHHGT